MSQSVYEDLLRAQVIAAQESLDAARDLIQNDLVTEEEGKRLYQAAFRRYAYALRRFSGFVFDGVVPEDLRLSWVRPQRAGGSGQSGAEPKPGPETNSAPNDLPTKFSGN